MVRSISRCSRLSPTQMMGMMPLASSALALALTSISSSPWYWRRSEWPTMQYFAPMSWSWLAETSPVYAPLSNLLTSCPPAATLASLPALTMVGIITAGVQRTTSQALGAGMAARSSSMKGLISEASMFIFQLPAITVLRYFLFICISPFREELSYSRWSLPFWGRHLRSSYLSSRQATPGSSLPSRNSRDAPPPVEMWVILEAKPSFSTAAALSPPPTMVTASLSTRA